MKNKRTKNKRSQKNNHKRDQNVKEPKRNYFKNFKGLFLLILAIVPFIVDFGTLKQKFWDKAPITKYAFFNLETISELKRLNHLYDDTGESKHIDQIVEIIVHNFYTLRYKNPVRFNEVFSQTNFINSASPQIQNLKIPYMGLTNIKKTSDNELHDIEYVARVKENIVQTYPNIPFIFWWEYQTILDDHSGNKYTRRSVILNYARHRLNKQFDNIKEAEIIKRFQFSGVYTRYNPKDGILTIEGIILRPIKSLKESKTQDEDLLLFENIRGISGEIAETLEASFINNKS